MGVSVCVWGGSCRVHHDTLLLPELAPHQHSSRVPHRPAPTCPFFMVASLSVTAAPMQSSALSTGAPISSDRRGCTGLRRNLSSGPFLGRPRWLVSSTCGEKQGGCRGLSDCLNTRAPPAELSPLQASNRAGTYTYTVRHHSIRPTAAAAPPSSSTTTRTPPRRAPWRRSPPGT